MIRRKVKYRDQNSPQRGDHWDDPVNYCNDGYLLDFIEMGGYIRAIVETIPSGLTTIVYASDIIFVEAPFNCTVQFIGLYTSSPIMNSEFQQWGFNQQQQSIAIVKLTEDVPILNYTRGQVINCFPNELHFLS